MKSVGMATAGSKLEVWPATLLLAAVVTGLMSRIDPISVLLIGSVSSACGGLFCWLLRAQPDEWSAAWQRTRMRRDPALFRAYRSGAPLAWRVGTGLLAGLTIRVAVGL